MPFCKYGHHMVLRDGQYGEFYGCSAYPSCKETKSIYSSSSGNRPKKNYSKSIFLGIVDVLLGASFSKSGYGRQYRLAKKTTKYVYKKSTSTYKKPNSNYKNQNYANRNKTTSQYYKQSNSASPSNTPTQSKKKTPSQTKTSQNKTIKKKNTDNLRITKSQEDKMERLLEMIRGTDLEMKIFNKFDSNTTRKEYKLLVEEIENYLHDRKKREQKEKAISKKLDELDRREVVPDEPTLEDLIELEDE
tara:strand:+ start:1018 stop:1755 length:738 start_codon:yes stop_codon:yes gene_type:complete